MLHINPEFYTIWNFRREILLSIFEDSNADRKALLEDDLKLVMAQLKRFPKCYWIWNHRIWCLSKLQEINAANWKYELAIVSKLLDLDSRNYHGWQYRRYIVKNMEEDGVRSLEDEHINSKEEKKLELLLKISLAEFDFTVSKINKNISNFSAWHNRSKLIFKIYELFSKIQNKNLFPGYAEVFACPYNILVHELELLKTGMYMDADDSSIWTYLKWILTEEFFINDLKKNKRPLSFIEILQEQLNSIEELNELEKDDNSDGLDNPWCLKLIIIIKSLMRAEELDESHSNADLLSDQIKGILQKLVVLDPLRKGKYLDQLNGVLSTTSF